MTQHNSTTTSSDTIHSQSETDSAGNSPPARVGRREVLRVLAGAGIGSLVFQRALAAQAEAAGSVTAAMIQEAEWIAGIELSDKDRESTAGAVQRACRKHESLRAVKIDYEVPPAVHFYAAPTQRPSHEPVQRTVETIEAAAPLRPASDEDLAFLPVTELAALLRTRQVSSVELTKLYLARLRQYDPVLRCVVNYTDELAMKQAERADREMAAGRYRGPLHGVPWGAKDLIAVPGYKTTWGAPPFKDQVIDVKATVARRLEDAGAVLVAKLSLGALAMGDQWFGGMTRNPWNPKEGSSGSSAGSTSAVVAGLVGFAIGSETLGSIISPGRRCGSTSLRPTFGRVSRHGCMPLAWTMDKLGPIARSVEDCAIVLAAIHGHDGLDPTAIDQPFTWPPRRDVWSLTVGYVKDGKPLDKRHELQVLKDLGVKLVPIKLPDQYPVSALTTILNTEAATVFDELTRRGITEGLNSWPTTFRQGQFVPAVEYLRAMRVRTLLMREMEQVMKQVDVYVEGDDLTITNFTGHPSIVLPDGRTTRGGAEVPATITFTGRLFGETDLLAVAHAYQQSTGDHLRRPPMDKVTPENAGG
jgi:Asp-tRNA(Asn)/Glu-tRNA(Gln) amidotransferase A subunit family amidase